MIRFGLGYYELPLPVRLGRLRESFQRGEIFIEDLPLHLEPLLWSAVEGDEKVIIQIMNELEMVLFACPADQQLDRAFAVFDQAAVFLSTGEERASEDRS